MVIDKVTPSQLARGVRLGELKTQKEKKKMRTEAV